MNFNFRTLTAREIECRVQQVKANGLSLLLYKDARCDMNILDETVGAENWQRRHSRDNANCTLSIWDEKKQQWISKEDTGTESNTEAEKGLASDSFKRAGFNWGIGRELYTAPFIWITAEKANIQNGKCYEKFSVSAIDYNKFREIDYLQIINEKSKAVVYQFGRPHSAPAPEPASKELPFTVPTEIPAGVPTAQEFAKLDAILEAVDSPESATNAIKAINGLGWIDTATQDAKKRLIKKANSVGLTFDRKAGAFVRKSG